MTLEFNGIAMPIPKAEGFTIGKNKIWSKNAGRNDLGTMVGTILAIKYKVEIEWPPLDTKQIELIDNIVSDINNPFTQIRFTNERGEVTEITAYFGDATYPVYGTNIYGKQIMTGVKIDGIQQ